jgi:L-threonylcarbamoyladenylate synthase
MKTIDVKNTNIEDIITAAVETLTTGGLVIYPTETCYGVGVNALNEDAVKKLLKYKKRPEGKAISIAVSSMEMAQKYVELNPVAQNVYKTFLPGPVTVISNDLSKVCKELVSEDKTLGVRIPKYELITKIIEKCGFPVSATSANSAGKKNPYKISDILENISQKQKDLIDLIIDAGELEHNPPSTVIDTTKEEMKVLRRGEVKLGKLLVDRVIKSDVEMQEAGLELISKHKNLLKDNCLLIMFNAELGAGKTQFVKGVAKAVGIKNNINSPTFILIKEYPFENNETKGELIHIDAWRLESLEELRKLELEDYIKIGNILAVEWAGKAQEYLESISDSNVIKIYVEINYLDLNTRSIKIYDQEGIN